MNGVKTGRIAGDIRREMVEILREVKDPRVSGLLSIVKVDVSGDLSYAKIYVSAIEGAEKTAESVAGLKSAAGYIRRELGHRLQLRKVPEVKFLADDSIAQSAHIAGIIEGFKD